jgi:hypothetical protein
MGCVVFASERKVIDLIHDNFVIVGVCVGITNMYGVDVVNNVVDTSVFISVIGVYDGHAHDVGVFNKVVI